MQPYEEKQRRLRRRRHLRHQLRVRLRLPARQHGDGARGEGPARPPLRDRRRGRQHPHRRGAHAADHLRRARAGRRPLRASSPSSRRRWSAARSPRAWTRARRRSSSPTSTTSSTRSTRRSRSPSRASRRPSASSASTTSTAPRTATSSTTSIQALKAESLYKRDVDYAVIDGEVKIIDEFTGRILEGRRWSEGLHQAVEAKEGVRDPGGEPDARDDHAAELLPHVRQARRHDRHGAHRGDRVHEDLQARPSSRSRPTSRWSATDHNDQIYKTKDGKWAAVRRRDRGAPRGRPAGARRHDLGRGLRAALRAAEAARASSTRC